MADRSPPAAGAPRLERLLVEVASRLGDAVILWRGPELTGNDVDLLVVEHAADELDSLLAERGLHSLAEGAHRSVWHGAELPLDVLVSSAWPRYYPSLAGLRARVERRDGEPSLASVEDRLLMLAAEAVGGRPLAKLAPRVRSLLAPPGAWERLREVAAQERLDRLVEVLPEIERLARTGAADTLPLVSALRAALRGRAAAVALAERVAWAVRERVPAAPGTVTARARSCLDAASGRGPSPLLVTVSGIDGAGKSDAVEVIRQRLERRGLEAEVAWFRLGSDWELLERVGRPIKRLLRRSGRTADPVAAAVGGVDEREVALPRASERRGIVSWAWIGFVTALAVRACRRAARRRARPTAVVCDRWATDALVDLALRYGRHRLGEAMLRRLSPRPAAAVLLVADAETAYGRGIGEQPLWVLQAMEAEYSRLAAEPASIAIDATAPREEVVGRLQEIVDGALAARAARR